jgi:trans-2,3-dihydro-3-hydroxyanthranilate isomerase
VRTFAFHHVDVFTSTPFEGKPLAVFTDGRELDGATMQRIAREMNLSETVFVLPPKRGDALAAVRIFTPAAELSFAGHPTIGAAFVLQATGRVAHQQRSFVLEEGIGPVPVRIDPGEEFTAWLTTPPISLGASFDDRAATAAALGLAASDVRDDAPVQVVTAGNPFLYVPLQEKAAVDRAALDARAMRRVIGEGDYNGVYLFAADSGGVYSRMFAPDHGIVEDPATGSATGPLAAYLLEHGIFAPGDPLELVAEQGTHMGRRSILRIRVTGTGSTRRIEVGGSAVALIEGTLRIP